jgi:hypothetical protein
VKLSETRDKDGKIIKQKLDQFIAERESDPQGDKDVFEQTVGAMAGKSSAARPASSKDCADD